jgi:hypothetical protein
LNAVTERNKFKKSLPKKVMSNRQELGEFISVKCFKAVIAGMEDLLGKEGTAAALISAGRKRGETVAKDSGMAGAKPEVAKVAETMNGAVGAKGTCLCVIAEVTATAEGGFLVKTKETVCSAGEPAGSTRTCTYTLGAVMGFLESAYGVKLSGRHTASVLSGSATDDFVFSPSV